MNDSNFADHPIECCIQNCCKSLPLPVVARRKVGDALMFGAQLLELFDLPVYQIGLLGGVECLSIGDLSFTGQSMGLHCKGSGRVHYVLGLHQTLVSPVPQRVGSHTVELDHVAGEDVCLGTCFNLLPGPPLIVDLLDLGPGGMRHWVICQ